MITDKQFDVLKDFNFPLVRIKPADKVINGARLILTKGLAVKNTDDRALRQKSKSMAASLLGRKETLEQWSDAQDWDRKVEIYTEDKERAPQMGVFNAVNDVNSGLTVYAAAKQNGVNDMTVTALTRRIAHYEKYAAALKNAT